VEGRLGGIIRSKERAIRLNIACSFRSTEPYSNWSKSRKYKLFLGPAKPLSVPKSRIRLRQSRVVITKTFSSRLRDSRILARVCW
jgi:hypothetical protein